VFFNIYCKTTKHRQTERTKTENAHGIPFETYKRPEHPKRFTEKVATTWKNDGCFC